MTFSIIKKTFFKFPDSLKFNFGTHIGVISPKLYTSRWLLCDKRITDNNVRFMVIQKIV